MLRESKYGVDHRRTSLLPVTRDGTASIAVWDTPNSDLPTERPVAGGDAYGIEESVEATARNQCDLLPFIEEWVRDGKPDT